jgi:hypothetical protein
MANHTKEPWRLVAVNYKSSSHYILGGGLTWGKGAVAHIPTSRVNPSEENARRIVACVNACEGISTETMENMVAEGATLKIRARDNIADAGKLHAKLLAAAKHAVRVIAEERAGGSTESKRLMQQAQAMLFSAISEADPAYYGKNLDLEGGK